MWFGCTCTPVAAEVADVVVPDQGLVEARLRKGDGGEQLLILPLTPHKGEASPTSAADTASPPPRDCSADTPSSKPATLVKSEALEGEVATPTGEARSQVAVPLASPAVHIPDSEFTEFQQEVMKIYAVPGSHPDLAKLMAGMRAAATTAHDAPQVHVGHEPTDDVLFARLLISVDWDLKAAVKLLHERISFRDPLGKAVPPPVEWLRQGIVHMPFEDKHGRPIVFVRITNHEQHKLSSELFQQGFRACLDLAVAYLTSRRKGKLSTENPLEQVVLICELQDSGWKNFAPDHWRIMLRESKKHFPELLSKAVILRPNLPFQAAMRIISPLLPVRTRAKVEVVPESHVKSFMQGLVPLDKLPEVYGGTAPNWVVPSAATTLSELCGELAAAEWQRLGIAPKLG